MKHQCKITVIKRHWYPEVAESFGYFVKGPCDFYHDGQEFIVNEDSYARMMDGKFCGEAWDCIKRYVFTALHGGTMISQNTYVACCNDGSRPVLFRIERIDLDEGDAS